MTKYQTEVPQGVLVPQDTHLMVKTEDGEYLFLQERDNKVYVFGLVNHAYGFIEKTKWDSLKDVINYYHKVWLNPASTKPKEVGTKYDTGKVRYSLLPKGVLEKVLNILEFGANKYKVITFHAIPQIGKLIEDKLWQSKQNAYPVGSSKVFYPKVTVQHATEQSSISKLYAQAVANSSLLQPKMESAVFATNLNDLPNALMNSKHVQNIKKNTETIQSFECANESDSANEVLTLSINPNKKTFHGSERLLSMELRSNSTTVFMNEDVQSVEVKNVHTLTTTITQGSFETYFVVSATKLSDCYETLLLLLKGCFNISVSINEISSECSGKDNWQQVPNARDRYYDAAMRHIQAWYYGETKDPETGESHLAHALCCLMFLLWFDIK